MVSRENQVVLMNFQDGCYGVLCALRKCIERGVGLNERVKEELRWEGILNGVLMVVGVL